MLFPQHKMYYIWQYSVGQIKGVWNKIGSYFMYIKKKKKVRITKYFTYFYLHNIQNFCIICDLK